MDETARFFVDYQKLNGVIESTNSEINNLFTACKLFLISLVPEIHLQPSTIKSFLKVELHWTTRVMYKLKMI